VMCVHNSTLAPARTLLSLILTLSARERENIFILFFVSNNRQRSGKKKGKLMMKKK
jgi:hypothetical protein